MLKGVPGIYIHSLLGSRNYYKGVEETGIKRMINREKMPWHSIEASLSEVTSQPYQILDGLLHLLNVRGQIPSFHPSSTREVIDSDKRLIIIKRSFRGETVWAVINVSQFEIALPEYKGRPNVVGNEIFDGNVEPYGVYILAFP